MAKLQRLPDSTLEESPIHEWFGLSRSSYFVIPRLALESMPLEWQRRFIALMDEAEERGLEAPRYRVIRDDPEYGAEVPENEDDPHGPTDRIDVRRPDPWADYRHGSIEALCPSFKVPD